MMFRIRLRTDPHWAALALRDPEEILSDHAWCEQKAATTAISLISQYSDFPELVAEMTALAQEELQHFARVVEVLRSRGLSLRPQRRDAYVNDLMAWRRAGGSRVERLRDHLLVGAMIEARSCDRFRVLSENVPDEELRSFYRELMESEAGHYTVFIGLARQLTGRSETDARWKELLDYEDRLIQQYSSGAAIHG